MFNADDFGLSPEINVAILELAEKKALTSTTVMANLVQLKDIEKLKSLNIGIGLHLNLSDGRPISPANKVKSLVDKSGNFKKWPELLMGFLIGRVKKKHIEMEIIAQLETLKSYHIKISHADSHKHLHQFPILGPFILKVFKEQGIKKVRNCFPTHTNNLQMKILNGFSLTSRHALKDFIKPDALFSYFSAFPESNYDNFNQSLKTMFVKYNRIEVILVMGSN